VRVQALKVLQAKLESQCDHGLPAAGADSLPIFKTINRRTTGQFEVRRDPRHDPAHASFTELAEIIESVSRNRPAHLCWLSAAMPELASQQ